jgi:hypothetical protein
METPEENRAFIAFFVALAADAAADAGTLKRNRSNRCAAAHRRGGAGEVETIMVEGI